VGSEIILSNFLIDIISGPDGGPKFTIALGWDTSITNPEGVVSSESSVVNPSNYLMSYYQNF